MNKNVIAWICISTLLLAAPVQAQYQSTAYGGSADETFWSRTTDWFATAGKSEKEKYRILNERRAARKVKKAKRAIAQKKKEMAQKKKAYQK